MRTKKTVKTNVSLTEAQAAANQYSSAVLKTESLTAKMNEELNVLRKKYEPQISELQEVLKEPVEVLQSYALEQRTKWDGKSVELGSCVIGFRTNPASVAKKKGFTWDAVVGLFKTNKLLKPFVKVKEDIDKAALLKEQTNSKIVSALEKVGVVFEQEEEFFVNPKKEKAI